MDDALTPQIGEKKFIAARASIVASACLTLAKLAAGLWSGSLALLSEAAHAATDTGATILTYYALRAADRPADDAHHYGHGKIESLAALAETGFLFGLALFVAAQAIARLGETPVAIDVGWPVFAVLGVSIVVDATRAHSLSAIARDENSEALAADAMHFLSDLVGSLLVLAGLVASHFGFARGDALAAIGVAGFIAIAGFRLGRRTIATLLDAAPQDLTPEIDQAMRAVPGVVDIESLRLRRVGATIFGEATVMVSRTLNIEEAARIKAAVIEAATSVAPGAQLTVTTTLRALDDETVHERILLVAARRGLPVHHIVTQEIDARLSISLDIELDGAMQHGRAHAVATAFESAVRDEFGHDVEIETHLEPLSPSVMNGRDANDGETLQIANALARHAAAQGAVDNIHDLRVRETAAGLVVNFHCRVDAKLTVAQTHEAVDEVERGMRLEFPHIARIAGHAEPFDH